MEERANTKKKDKQKIGLRYWNNIVRVWRVCSHRVTPFVWLFPPSIVFIAMLIYFASNGYYPFGNMTVSWCDMDQQVVPLLIQLKDVLAGKSGLFLNFKNASGMNLFGVYFFFLSSPFTFLVTFVPKEKIMLFANVLVVLKMCVIALTASVYFYSKNKRAFLLNISFSVAYAFSGYVMMYFQNVMWLDVVYLFPLILLGLDKLKDGKRTLFIVTLTACVFVNYYLSYMVVIFLLLYAFVWLILSKDKAFAGNFFVSCLIAMLLSAVVWLPCLVQYFSSGRTSSIYESLSSSSIATAHETAVPTIFSVLFLFPFALFGRYEKNKDCVLQLLLFLLTLVPIFWEPINKMWHIGSYMCFPTRYGFMPIFLCLSLSYHCLCDSQNAKKTKNNFLTKQDTKKSMPYIFGGLVVLLAILYCVFAICYTKVNHQTMDQYSHSLWGNKSSFEALLKVYAIALFTGIVIYFVWLYSLGKTLLLWVAVAVMIVSELYVAPMTYMHAGSHNVEWHLQAVELADKIEDDAFYRVKADKEYSSRDFDVNIMGALGYNALGHYTSLTPSNYMTAIKQFGYTSYWMEVGNSGGSILTDALLSVKYCISRSNVSADVYNGEYYSISSTPYCLPMGIIAKTDIIKSENVPDTLIPRAQFQQMLYEDFFGSTDGVKTYALEDAVLSGVAMSKKNGKYILTPLNGSGYIQFNVSLQGRHTVYFNAFDENNNALSQAINEKFDVTSPNYSVYKYPSQKQNGLLLLGEYADRTVPITVKISSRVEVRDIGVFAIDNARLAKDVANADAVQFTSIKNGLSGQYTATEKQCVFLSIPYDKGMRCTVNGKNVRLFEVYGGFTAFYVEKGENAITISAVPVGFFAGLTISLLAVGLCITACVFWCRKKWVLELPKRVNAMAYYTWIVVGVAVILAVYVVPLIICAL